jgi:TolB-like protein/class 3 adenylate cyclase/tetratricopeptide (TPR) repeat protein
MDTQEHRIERRLVAIFAADVAGYSRLMEHDEVETLRALTAHREVLDRHIARYGGRIANTAGDSVLAEFPSAVNAVQCAVEAQEALASLDLDRPAERRLCFRIGVHVGDVMVHGRDLLGDSVNIAARLESLAEAGGVCLSGAALDHVRKALPLTYVDLGAQTVKNIEEPVRTYRVSGGALSAHQTGAEQPNPSSAYRRPTIAVLPFANPGGDPDQQYFSDGITEDLVTDLMHFRELAVRAVGPSDGLRERGRDIRLLGRELDVQYLVHGSVRRLGNRIRVTVQLIETATGEHVWSERYDREQADLFAVQDEVVSTIGATLVGRLQAAGARQARRKPPAILAAYECVLRGRSLPVGSAETEAEARRWYEWALSLDPDYAQAYAHLSYMLTLEWFRDTSGSDTLLDRALELARTAVALDGDDPLCHDRLGWVHLHRKEFDLAEQHKLRALELNPGDPEQIACTGILFMYLGKGDEGIAWMERAWRLDPYFNPPWRWRMAGVAHFVAARYDEAIAAFGRSSPNPLWVQAYLAACHAHAGRLDVARGIASELHASWPDLSSALFTAREPFKRVEDAERLVQGMQLAGLPR